MTTLFHRAATHVVLAKALILAVALFTLGFLVETFASEAPFWQELLYVLLGLALAYGAFAHVLCHCGYVARLADETDGTTATDLARARATRFGALIPSYREEPEFVYRALLSVALQRHENKWLRLLVDDPPAPGTDDQRRLLDAARALPSRVQTFLQPLHYITQRAAEKAARDVRKAPEALVQAHRDLAGRFGRLAQEWPDETADDRFFRKQVLERLAAEHRREAQDAPSHPAAALAEIMRLDRRFRCDVATFERKRYENLSHAANKAMNLNTAIDLVGRRVRDVVRADKRYLEESRSGSFPIPEAEYLITLDADSLLSPDYAERLLAVMTGEGSERLAVVQTPYAALPETSTLLERIAGATTDVQRILHQGFARFDAAFWVGANAVLRVSALRDIATEEVERGHVVRRYVQDRTPIEDTESTIDLAVKGWRVHNHDAILAWSATPPDFGALVIQRRRWACGGLIVLPKAIRAALAPTTTGTLTQKALQAVVRFHYLGSMAWGSAALVLLMADPFHEDLNSVFLLLVAVPYFLAYVLDLTLSKRSIGELVAVCFLNLLLVPVNLAGALASLRQAVTGQKVPFARTPKVDDRTAAPFGILAAVAAGALFFGAKAAFEGVVDQHLFDAALAGINGAALLFAMAAFIGWRAMREDMLAWALAGRTATSSAAATLLQDSAGSAAAEEREKVRTAA